MRRHGPLCSTVMEARHPRHAEHVGQPDPAQGEAISTGTGTQLKVHAAACVEAETQAPLREILNCQLYILEQQQPRGKSSQGDHTLQAP